MNTEIELELVSGGRAKLTLPQPGEFESFYVFSTEYSGVRQFWPLLTRLMAAAERSVCDLDGLRLQGVRQIDVTRSAMHQLLHRAGYGFGVIQRVDVVPEEILRSENHKLLFLRDPRDMLIATYRDLLRRAEGASGSETGERAASRPASFGEYLESSAVEIVGRRYRRFAELWRGQPNTHLFRYEHALSDWHAIAAELATVLKLPLDPAAVSTIAADTSPIVGRPRAQVRPLPGGKATDDGLTPAETADLDPRFADVLAAFGYAPRRRPTPGRLPQVKDPTISGPAIQGPSEPGLNEPKAGRSALYERDPVLGLRLRPNSSVEVQVLGRPVLLDVDAAGCRPVIGQPAEGEKTVAVYGCSFTYGSTIMADETFCSLLQGMFPVWRVENHGVSGYGTAQNLLQLQRDIRWNQPELVTFCWIEHHLGRNVVEVEFLQQWQKWILHEIPDRPASVTWRPRATLDRDGVLQMQQVRASRHDLVGIDFSDFAPDRYYLDLICFRLFEAANAIVTGYGGHFFITNLRGQFSPELTRRLSGSGIPVVETSLSGEEYSCLPEDPHPNALAHRIYAERIRDYLSSYTDAKTGGQQLQGLG